MYIDASVALGDNESGYHGVVGIVWQAQKRGIMRSIDDLKKTYDAKRIEIYVMQDVERKNEIKASDDEEQKMKALSDKSVQMHSEKESQELLAELEETEKGIASGKIKASPRYERAIKYRKNSVEIFHKDIIRKSKAAKAKFKKLNPDLFYGDDVGLSYVGNLKKTVYLPLGPLSFADKVNHPTINDTTGK